MTISLPSTTASRRSSQSSLHQAHPKHKQLFFSPGKQQLDLPPELLEDEPGICAPNADDLFPEIKADLDRRITPENIYHFSWEELELIKQGASETPPQDLTLMQNKV